MPNTYKTFEKLPKSFNILPKWWNFAKYGHTDADTIYLRKVYELYG